MIDFHCHLDLYSGPSAVARDAVERGVRVLAVTTTPKAWHVSSKFANTNVRTALGLHPELAHERKGELALFEALLSETPYVGEVGLDGSDRYKPYRSEQVQVFRRILAACSKAGGKILSIHSRRAASPVLDCLRDFPDAGKPVLHWFSGTLAEAERAIAEGYWFSVGPEMLRSRSGRALATRLPQDRVLTESDGPFAKVANQPAMPWNMDAVTAELAALWRISPHETKARIELNFRTLLGPAGF